MNPLVSIIIPVYKVEPYLEKCINSVIQQTYVNLEIILVDDGSPDNCPAMCDAWALRDSRIRVIHQKNQGQSCARNNGLRYASGEFLLFVDSDDYIAQDTCTICMDAFRRTDADVVVFNASRVDKQGNIIEITEKITSDVISREAALRKLFRSEIHDYVWNKMYRSSVLSTIQFPEGRVYEDIGIMYKIFLNAGTVCTIPDPLYYYLKRADSTIGSMSDKTLEDLYEMRKERYNIMLSIDSEVAEYSFDDTAISALRLYDRSLWGKTDPAIVQDAQHFLRENKQKILESTRDKALRFYCQIPKLYVHYRMVKHCIGNIVKRLNHMRVRRKARKSI